MSDESVPSSTSSLYFRVAIVGAHKNRVAKVLQILHEQKENLQSQIFDHDTDKALFLEEKIKQHNIKVEYLPCVAKFESYKDEDNKEIQYLSKLEYYGSDGKQVHGSSLAPFFDENNSKDDKDNNDLSLPGIAAVAIGCGIEEPNHIEMIQSFINNMTQLTLSSDGDKVKKGRCVNIIVGNIKPNSEYSSMKEENEVYKKLDTNQKMEVNHNLSIGPGKMAKFSVTLVRKAMETIFPAITSEKKDIESNERELVSPIAANDTYSNEEDGANENHNKKEFMLETCDENKIKFACKICRTVLFGQDHLEDPPHTKGRHQFNHRQKNSCDKNSGGKCANVYLASEMNWMGDTNNYEGKLACPKCNTKLGLWNWAGSQCSCGTWVTPAIQIVLSKVDIIYPKSPESRTMIDRCSQALTSLPSNDTTFSPNTSSPVNLLAGLYIGGKQP